MPPIIAVHSLSHAYGPHVAVDSVSFDVERGALFAFLGPNGAGKSTTVAALTTLAPIQKGRVTYAIPGHRPWSAGRDDASIRSHIGVVFQDSLLDHALSVRTNLSLRAGLYGRADIGPLLAALRLDDIASSPYGRLSGGQRRRVDVARALIATPDVLFLDEPTTGLDPQSRQLVWALIDGLRREAGLTVFLTTHDMAEVEQADQVTIIDHGRLIAAGPPDALRRTYSHSRLRLHGSSALTESLTAAGVVWTRRQDVIDVPIDSPTTAASIIDGHAGLIDDFEFVHGTMDDVFLQLTGTSLRTA